MDKKCCGKPIAHIGLHYYRCQVCGQLYLSRPKEDRP